MQHNFVTDPTSMCKKQRTAFEENFKMKTSHRKWEIWNFYLYFKESYAYFKEKYKVTTI